MRNTKLTDIFPHTSRKEACQVGYGLQRRKIVLDNQDWSLDVQSYKRYSNIFCFCRINSMSKSDVRGVCEVNCNTNDL